MYLRLNFYILHVEDYVMNIVSDSVHSEQFDQLSTRSLRSLQSARKKFERCSPEPRTKLLQRQVSYPSKTYSSRVNIQRVIQQESMNMTPDTVWSFLGDMSWPEIALCAAALYALKKALSFALANCNLKLFEISDPPSNAYAGKVVWIVGASQGLGLALAEHFASQGAKLILSSRSVEKLEAVKLKCLKYIGENDVKILPVDITEEYAQVRQKTDMAFQEFEEGIDYIVHNAGASQHAAVEETSHDVAKALVDMNLLGEVSVARASLPHMLQRSKGHHIVIASMAACVPSPGQAMYSAAKSGLKSYFLSMSSEICARYDFMRDSRCMFVKKKLMVTNDD